MTFLVDAGWSLRQSLHQLRTDAELPQSGVRQCGGCGGRLYRKRPQHRSAAMSAAVKIYKTPPTKVYKMLKSTPTVYGGIVMRSRLETRWAAFFDLCGWRWRYEPFELPGWIPDFELTTPGEPFPVLVEVKPICWLGDPESDWAAELDHPEIQKIQKRGQFVLVLGAYPASGEISLNGFPAIGMWQTPVEGRVKARLQVVDGDLGVLIMPGRARVHSPPEGLIGSLWAETLVRTRTHRIGA